jgi:putative DNA primase/helicase
MSDNIYNFSDLQAKELITNTNQRIIEINSLVNFENIPDGFEVDEEAVWFLQEKNTPLTTREKICSLLWITAYTRDHNNENHGRILEFQDADGHKHIWTMPMELLAGESSKILGMLWNMSL